MAEDKEILMVWGMHIGISSKPEASQRTKNRIRERGREGFLVQSSPPIQSCKALENRQAVLVVAASDGERRGDRWMGWLPMNEVTITHWHADSRKGKV